MSEINRCQRVDPPAFSPRIHWLRNKIERFFNRIKNYPAIATRYDNCDANFLAAVKLASIRNRIGFRESVALRQNLTFHRSEHRRP